MTRAPDQGLSTGSPATVGCLAPSKALDLVALSDAVEAESSPWPGVARPFPPAPRSAPWSAWDLVDEWGMQSFPASDPPANW